jgi:HK97 family phage portal protein
VNLRFWQRDESPTLGESRPVRKALPPRRQQRSHGGATLKNNLELLLAPKSGAGIEVNEVNATTVAAVTACVSLLADMVALLPCKLYRKTDKGREEVMGHPAARVMRSPGDRHTSFELRNLMEVGKGLGGNGYARIYRNSVNEPVELEWLKPCDVRVEWIKARRTVAYHLWDEREPLTRADVLHVRGFSLDGVCGVSPIRLLRNAIGTSLSQSEAAGRLMKNGTIFPGYLVGPESLTKDQIADARLEWDRRTTGDNLGKPPIMWGGWDFKQTNGMTMADAQFIESRRFELQEIARMYRIPAFLIGDTTTSTTWGSGIEQQNLGFLSYSLNPHLVAWEQSLDYSLLTADELAAGYYFKFSRHALMQVALQAQAQFFQTMRSIGVYSVDEIRRKLEENDLDDPAIGKDYTLPFNNTGGAQARAAATEEEES